MPKLPEVTIRNTKADLFKAYQEMKEMFERGEKEQLPLSQLMAEKQKETEILGKTANFLPEKLECDIVSLGKEIGSSLEEVKKKLTDEATKLQEIRKAIEIETKRLEEIYNIKLTADTLKVLIADFEAKREEMEKRRKSEEAAIEEEILQKKKAWEREQEDYQYKLKFERKKEQDEYETKQAKARTKWQEEWDKKEIEINEKEKSLESRLEEIENMKEQIEDFPKKLEAAAKETKQETEKTLQKDFAVQTKISETQWVSEKKILENRISGLGEVIKNQSTEIASLKKSLSEAYQHAQNLAIAIIQNTAYSKETKTEPTEQPQQKIKEEMAK